MWTPLVDGRIAERWFTWPRMPWFASVPLGYLAWCYYVFRGKVKVHSGHYAM